MKQNLLINGDFSTGNFDGWSVKSEYVSLVDSNALANPEGFRYFALLRPAPSVAGSLLQQEIIIGPGEYTLKFAYARAFIEGMNPAQLGIVGLTYWVGGVLPSSILVLFHPGDSLKYEEETFVVPDLGPAINLVVSLNGISNDRRENSNAGPILLTDVSVVRQ
jgi:hypothetical protein